MALFIVDASEIGKHYEPHVSITQEPSRERGRERREKGRERERRERREKREKDRGERGKKREREREREREGERERERDEGGVLVYPADLPPEVVLRGRELSPDAQAQL